MKRPKGILISAILMILFGLAEVATGITGNFLNVISATATSTYTLISSLIGVFYCFAGLLILTMRRWAAVFAIILLGGDIFGRVAMVETGLYPFNGISAASIVAGTALAGIFAIYIWARISLFQK
jgi:hypothetical protein